MGSLPGASCTPFGVSLWLSSLFLFGIPEAQSEWLSEEFSSKKTPNFLFRSDAVLAALLPRLDGVDGGDGLQPEVSPIADA